MCLLTVFPKVNFEGREFFIGYKCFNYDINTKLPCSHVVFHYDYKLDTLLHANKSPLYTETGQQLYNSGFHIFLDKKCADLYYVPEHDMKLAKYRRNNHKTCRVLFNDIQYIGFNGNNWFKQINSPERGLTVIANQMIILSTDWAENEIHN
jgi:hypothetical protein